MFSIFFRAFKTADIFRKQLFSHEHTSYYYLRLSESLSHISKVVFTTLHLGHWFLLEHDVATGEVTSHNSLAVPDDDADSSDDVYFGEEYPLALQNYVVQFLRKDRPAKAVCTTPYLIHFVHLRFPSAISPC